jgi:hypothetical protein
MKHILIRISGFISIIISLNIEYMLFNSWLYKIVSFYENNDASGIFRFNLFILIVFFTAILFFLGIFLFCFGIISIVHDKDEHFQ